eukprot:ANDGO_02268.mRNA.1 hypothetical protein
MDTAQTQGQALCVSMLLTKTIAKAKEIWVTAADSHRSLVLLNCFLRTLLVLNDADPLETIADSLQIGMSVSQIVEFASHFGPFESSDDVYEAKSLVVLLFLALLKYSYLNRPSFSDRETEAKRIKLESLVPALLESSRWAIDLNSPAEPRFLKFANWFKLLALCASASTPSTPSTTLSNDLSSTNTGNAGLFGEPAEGDMWRHLHLLYLIMQKNAQAALATADLSDRHQLLAVAALSVNLGRSMFPSKQVAFSKSYPLMRKVAQFCSQQDSNGPFEQIGSYNNAVFHLYHHIDPLMQQKGLELLHLTASCARLSKDPTCIQLHVPGSFPADDDLDDAWIDLVSARILYQQSEWAACAQRYDSFFTQLRCVPARRSRPPLDIVPHLLVYADTLLRLQRYSLAESIAESLVQRNKNDANARILKVDAVVGQRRMSDAYQSCAQLWSAVTHQSRLQAHPSWKAFRQALITRMAIFQNCQRSRTQSDLPDFLEMVVSDKSHSISASYNVSLLLLARGDPGAAVSSFVFQNSNLHKDSRTSEIERRRRTLRETLRLPLPSVNPLDDRPPTVIEDALEMHLLDLWMEKGPQIFVSKAQTVQDMLCGLEQDLDLEDLLS